MSCGSWIYRNCMLYVRVLPLCVILLMYLCTLLIFIYSPTYCFFFLNILSLWQTVVMYRIAYYGLIGDRLQSRAEKVDYRSKYETGKTPSSLDWNDVKLYYLLPNYKEKVSVMKMTLERLAESQNINLREQVTVILCMEGRERESVHKANELRNEFQNVFHNVLISIHPPDIEGETPGKGSNLAWACKKVMRPDIKQRKLEEDSVLVMCTDADMLIHPKFLSAAFQKFCNCPPLSRYRSTWGGPLIMDLNIYEVPVLTRVMSMMANNTQINFIGDPCEHISQSTFVISFIALRDVGYWSPKYIAEDYHLYCRSKIRFRGKFSSKLIGLPICGYNLDSGGYLKTMVDRWHQAKRHALGMVEIVYVLRKTMEYYYQGKGLVMSGWKLFVLLYHLSFHHFILMTQFLTLTCAFTALNFARGIVGWFPEKFLFLEDLLENPYVIIFFYIQYSCSFPFMFAFFVHARYTCRKYWKRGYVPYFLNLAWYSFRNFLELSFFAPFGMMFYGAIPTVYEAIKLCFSEKYDFFVAGKEGTTVSGRE